MNNECVRARIAPEPCGTCNGCQAMRKDITSRLIPVLEADGRTVDDRYMSNLNTMPLAGLYAMLIHWTEPRYVW